MSVSLNDQSIADAGRSNITRLPLPMPMNCQEFVLCTREGVKKIVQIPTMEQHALKNVNSC
jgi:hypothetical protein